MKASINGETREFAGDLTIAELLAALDTPRRGIAVARNDRVVRRNEFDCEPVQEGDRIEIIKAVSGG